MISTLSQLSIVHYHTTAKDMGIKVTSAFKPCEDCALRKAKQLGISKKAVAWSNISREKLFFDINSSSILTFGGNKN